MSANVGQEDGRVVSHDEAKPESSWDTKRRCTCGEEFASGCQLAIHQASSLAAEVAGLRTQLAKARADHVAWCEANYTIGRENQRVATDQWRDAALKAEAERDRLAGQVDAIRALHAPCPPRTPEQIRRLKRRGLWAGWQPWCEACSDDQPIPWPCDTIRLLAASTPTENKETT